MRLRAFAVVVALVSGCQCGAPPVTNDGGNTAASSCDAGLTACAAACVDTTHDDANCAQCGAACAANQSCAGALCLNDDCAAAPCSDEQVCVNERCVDKACVGVICAAGFTCARGICLPAACGAVGCPAGAVCENGSCVDAACAGVICPSGATCSHGLCVTLACTNGTKDGTETDLDCGGNCAPCRAKKACLVDADCFAQKCLTGLCVPAPGCTDGVVSGSETDVDCGGPGCLPCAAGATCRADFDCAFKPCASGKCAGPTCSDLLPDGHETDVDCGGDGGCMACGDGRACGVAIDCTSQVCDGGRCAAPSCGDGVANGKETDTDCGGDGGCPTCGQGKRCTVAFDCVSRSCTALRCDPLSCGDTVKNGSETDTDCGGACPACIPGQTCAVAADCTSSVCVGTVCQSPACNDQVRNGSELGVDCGGNCYPCGLSRAVGYPVGTGPDALAVGDFNKDGRLDLAVANHGGANVSILLGAGNGTFGNAQQYNTNAGGYDLAAAEVSGDTNLDLVVRTDGDGNSNTVQVLVGNGDGTFGNPIPVNAGSFFPRSATFADVNADGKLDVVVGLNSSAAVNTCNGDTTFTNRGVFFFAGYVHSVAAADFSGDGRVDLALQEATGSANALIHFIKQEADGGFPRVDLLPDGGLTEWAQHVVVSPPVQNALWTTDLNADGKPDLFFSDGPRLAVVLNRGDGGFENFGTYGNASCNPRHTSAGNLNADAGPAIDLVSACAGIFGVGLHLGTGAGNFSQTVIYAAADGGGGNATATVLGDFDKDGKPDVAMADSVGNRVWIYLNQF